MTVTAHALAIGLLALSGCGGAYSAPASPAQGGSAWLEVTTRRFVLHTDLDEGAARAAAREFEDAYRYLERVAFPGHEGLTQRMDVVCLRDAGEFHHFFSSQADIAGIYFDQMPSDVERAPTMVLYGGLQGDARAVFLHELTHRLMSRAYGWTPPWLNEGLADYYSTMMIQSGWVFLGMVPPRRLFLRLGVHSVVEDGVPTVQDLVHADHAAFYGDWSEASSELHRLRYFAGAYALVHMLLHGTDEQRKRFGDFIDAMDRGTRASDAWAQTIGTVPDDDLETAFRAHLSGWRSWSLNGTPVPPLRPSPPETVAVMRQEEVRVLWARLLSAARAPLADVRSELDRAVTIAPDSPAVAYARGCLELSIGRTAEARALFEAALARAPDDPRYLYATMLARSRAGVRSDGEAIEKLLTIAKSSDELSAAALLLLELGARDAALRMADAAVAADPGYPLALAARAAVQFDAGRFAEAVADQERAVAFAPEHVDERPLIEALEKYRRALASKNP
jgi:tetratricopeptide (TPR) repeat protein